MMAFLMPPAVLDAMVREPDPDSAWTLICILGVVASHLYPFIWLAVAS